MNNCALNNNLMIQVLKLARALHNKEFEAATVSHIVGLPWSADTLPALHALLKGQSRVAMGKLLHHSNRSAISELQVIWSDASGHPLRRRHPTGQTLESRPCMPSVAHECA